ncbi:MAG: HAD family phosphatase [Candidatus Omnitrophica bacterium]|nr:HAD family phosphatase [Candidatus Omnitrophota bacterium]
MKYKIVIFDIDGTITRHVSSWRLIHEKLGLWDVLARKYQDAFLTGKISYRKFCELDAAHWKGIPEKRLHDIFKAVKYSKNVKKTLALLRKKGLRMAAISTGLQFVTDKIKKELGIALVRGNRLNARNGRLTGGVTVNIPHGGKGAYLRKMLKKEGLRPHDAIVVGDSEGDIPMARIAGYSIAFNSTSAKLTAISDYKCRTKDFLEVGKKILEIL